jgi:hypothetical protein
MRYFTLAILLVSLSGFSQTISKQVIGPAGATYENGTNKLSYTAGEVLVGAMTSEDGSIQLGNGYYPSLDLSTLNTESSELQLQVKVYPNHRSMKNIVKLHHYYSPSELENEINDWVEYYNNERYHESLSNVTPSDVYFGKEEKILQKRKQTKLITIQKRRHEYLKQKLISA